MRPFLLSALFLAATTLPLALVACAGGSDDSNDQGSEDEIRARNMGLEGDFCSETAKCRTGLLCKNKPSGPPPGAVGMPLPADTSASHGPPPGAVGMPMRPQMTCQKPAAGEEGGACINSGTRTPCNAGLICDYGEGTSSSGGPPPGAVGMPLPPSAESSGPPPGAVGMPMQRQGVCKVQNGPPPGAVGMPIQH